MREMARGIDATPYLEWLDGVETDAVSPNTPHGIVAMTIAEMFNRRGDSFGLALPEVHLRLNDTPGSARFCFPALRSIVRTHFARSIRRIVCCRTSA